MQIKQIKPINFLYFRTETKISELAGFISRVPKALHLEAAKLGLHVMGPVYWNYFNFAGDDTKPFILEISIPVDELPVNYQGEFLLKRTPDFKCLSVVHYGDWYEIPKTYGSLMEYIHHHQLKPTLVNREVYIHCDFKDVDANVTEIQLGIE
jgi:effector-binding domain-containing protein